MVVKEAKEVLTGPGSILVWVLPQLRDLEQLPGLAEPPLSAKWGGWCLGLCVQPQAHKGPIWRAVGPCWTCPRAAVLPIHTVILTLLCAVL